MKSWLATGAILLALFQLRSALAMWGRLPGVRGAPAWLPAAHRWSGTAAFLLSLPVAYPCLWSIGFTTDRGARVLAHSLVGCAFSGAFTTKLLALRTDGPRWALPVIGATVLTGHTVLWLTSSLWFFTTVDVPAFR